MYLEHFGLNEAPFRITPHTDFFFDGANRGATLDALIYAVTHDEGIVKVSGEVGSGKTMLCRVLMERLPDTVTIIYLANPSLSREDILYAIADELRLNLPENARTSAVLRALQDHLIKSFSEGRQVVVLIDEAHAMPAETLEEIRLLSNLETNRNKLLQLVLFGQPELNDVLGRSDMRQLKERITHNFGLEPLVRDDISNYLDFRMRAAGYRGPSVFAPIALKMIAQTSFGLTRRINILADKALLAAFSANSHQIGAREMQAAIRDCDFSDTPGKGHESSQRPHNVWITAGATLIGAAVATVIVWKVLMAPAPSVPSAPSAPSVPTAPSASVAPVAAPTAPAAAPVIPAAPTTPPAAPATPTPAAPTAAEKQAASGTLTTEYLKTSRIWLDRTPNDRWFLQLVAKDEINRNQIEAFLHDATAAGANMGNVRVYFSELSGKPKYGIIYGEFPNRAAALAAVKTLPPMLKATQPYPRQVIRLR